MRDWPSIRVLDVGAMSEGEDRYSPLVRAGKATVTGFEPNPEQFQLLQAKGGPNRYIQAFLGDGEQASFQLTRWPGCSSLLQPNVELIELFETIGAKTGGNFTVVESVPVQTTRLDDIRPPIQVDYIKIDVQGAELDVLRNGVEVLRGTVVIESEVEFVPLYEGQPLFGDIQCFLRDQGFVLHKFVDVAGRAFRPFRMPNPYVPLSQLLWADAIFVRDFTRLELWGDEDLLRGAVVLDVAYHSYDLAALLLQEYECRKPSGLYKLYLTTLSRESLQPQTCNIKDHS